MTIRENIPNLSEDKAIVDYGVDLTGEDIIAVAKITIPSIAVPTSVSNQGLTASTNQSTTVVGPSQDQQAGANVIVQAQGIAATGGVLTAKNTEKLPNIFFNFRSKGFINTDDLLFKFETSNLTVADYTGSKISTWTANQNIRPSVSLTTKDVNSPYTSGNFLSVVKAYDKYFYELDRYKKLENIITLPIRTNPSYTILVYAVAKQTPISGENVGVKINSLHSFYDNDIAYLANAKNINIGDKGYFTSNGQRSIYTSIPTASFVGNTLNSDKYSYVNTNERFQFNQFINITAEPFYKFVGVSTQGTPFNYFKNVDGGSEQNYSQLDYSNIANLKNNISNPDTAVPFVLNTYSSPINLNHFSLYFVEMFSYREGSDANNNILKLQTFVNGLLTYDGNMKLKKTLPINSFGNFKIRLANDYVGPADNNIKLFLFDYMHGVSNSSVDTMKTKSRNIVESLAYDYRNIILKSTTDIQLSSSTINKSLSFKPVLAHPFLKLFFQKSE